MPQDPCHRIRLRELQLEKAMSPMAQPQERYAWIMERGRTMEKLPKEAWLPAYRVAGCQSEMYLKAELKEGVLHLAVGSDALISAGLAALMLDLYQDATPDEILVCRPTVFQKLGLQDQLTPGRAQGLSALYRAIYQAALRVAQ